jgi:PAS domain S-box-containing protein
MTASSFPIWFVDVIGSVLMIVFSFLCLRLARKLHKKDVDNVIWMYLLWVCYGLSGFAVSRSVGHIIKQILLLSGQPEVWSALRPATGAINSLMFVFVGSVTLYFQRTWVIYRQISRDKQSLEAAHGELLYLNQNLEALIKDRTQALVESENKYRHIFESSQDMILIAKLDGTILEINPQGYQALGFPENDPELKSQPFQSYFDRKKEWQAIRQEVRSRGSVTNREVDLIRPDGSTRRSLVSAGLGPGTAASLKAADIRADNDTAIQFMVKDIEKQRQMREQIAQADKLASLGELSAGIAHEINNPLGIILGYTQLLLRSETDGSERQADLQTIEKHVRNCKSIVENLLNFTRTAPPVKEEVHIHDTLDDVIKFIGHHADLERIDFKVRYDCNIPNLMLDEKKIRQVFINLLMNAVHAIGKQGTIKVTTQFDALREYAQVNIADTGYGIEQKDLVRIFDPFYTTKPTGEGTGLGLSVSYGIIKNHGGTITVKSKPGHGTTFTVDLPIHANQVG